MFVTIDGTDYTKTKNLSFAPEADVTAGSLPINEFSVEITTDDEIEAGRYAQLYDDRTGVVLNHLWAKYWIVYAERMDKNTVRIRAVSDLRRLERRQLPAVMYSSEPIGDVLADIFADLGADAYSVDSQILLNETVSGFCPEQNARDRLLWVLFTARAYIRTFFAAKIVISRIDSTETMIPMADTDWKPSVTYKEYVTELNITAFSFAQGTPDATDEWVTDGTDYYIVTRRVFTLANPDAPAGAEPNGVSFGDVFLVNENNAAAILTRLGQYYFKRAEIEANVINNAQYMPGDLVSLYTDDDQMFSGYIDSASFQFGVQAKSKIHLTGVDSDNNDWVIGRLTVRGLFRGDEYEPAGLIRTEYYSWPVGYPYSIENPFVEGARYVYRPENADAAGTMASEAQTATEYYVAAIRQLTAGLEIISMSDALQTTAGTTGTSYDVVVEKDGVQQLHEGAGRFTLPKLGGGSCAFIPLADVRALLEPGDILIRTYSDVVIREGRLNCQFRGTTTILLPLQGGGWSEWCPEEMWAANGGN